jgi:hypothetical protein
MYRNLPSALAASLSPQKPDLDRRTLFWLHTWATGLRVGTQLSRGSNDDDELLLYVALIIVAHF